MKNEDGPCFYCGEMTSHLAGDPGKWPLIFSQPDGTGVARFHHSRCVVERLTAPARQAREAVIRECELAARGPVYAEVYNGHDCHNWSRDSDYGRGRHAAADAIAALSALPSTGLPAHAPHAEVREALEHLGNALYFVADIHPDDRNEALDSALAFYNDQMPRCKVEPSGHGFQRLIDPALALPQSTDGGGK